MSTQHKQAQQQISDYQEELEQVEAELASVELSLQELLERQNELTRKRSEIKSIISNNETSHKQQKDIKVWNGTDFPWTEEIDEKLKSVFGLKGLRPMQRQTMNATLSGEDCLLIMPTGGGKSLCFQLPAVVSKGLTLVVSPLVSLMEDQQMALEQLNVSSSILNASSSKELQKFVLDDMVKTDGSLRLLYVTPEKLAKSKRFMNKLEKCYSIGHLCRVVIDEVHCCSQWGHDFRPDYKFLGIMKRQFPNAPILGLTATATTKVLEDVKKILNIPRALVLKASFNRPNLFYEVREKPNAQKDSFNAIASLIQGKFKHQSGIVYCFSRKESEEVTTELSSQGIKAGCYHADMDAKSRSLVHRKWLDGHLQVVVATVAFGMGIDKPDVRFVIHHTVSKSMENLYQESGRAGRDSKRADCIVFYRLSDVVRQSSMVFTEQTGLSNLHGIVKYCTDVQRCRRSVIARHFGEVWDSTQCDGMCDMCDRKSNGGGFEPRDMTRHCLDVLTILDAAGISGQRVTAAKLADAWYGKGPPGLKVKTVKAPSLLRPAAERVLAHMLVNEYLSEDFHFTAYSTICYLVPGPKARLIRTNAAKVFMDFPIPLSKSTSSTSSSSSSSSSSKPSLKSSASKSGKESQDKPKLVIVNSEKSHFNSMSFPSALSSSSSKSSSSKSPSSKSSSSKLSSSKSSSSKSPSSKSPSSNSLSKSSSSSSSAAISSSSSNNLLKAHSFSPSSKVPTTPKNITPGKLNGSKSLQDIDVNLNFDDDDDFRSMPRKPKPKMDKKSLSDTSTNGLTVNHKDSIVVEDNDDDDVGDSLENCDSIDDNSQRWSTKANSKKTNTLEPCSASFDKTDSSDVDSDSKRNISSKRKRKLVISSDDSDDETSKSLSRKIMKKEDKDNDSILISDDEDEKVDEDSDDDGDSDFMP